MAAVSKAALRKLIVPQMRGVDAAARAERSGVAAAHVSGFLHQMASAKPDGPPFVVFAFLSQSLEADTAPLLDLLWGTAGPRRFDVFVPHVIAAGDKETRGGEMVFVEAKGAADVAAAFPEQGKMKLRELTAEAFAAAVPFDEASAGARRVITADVAPRIVDAVVAPGLVFSQATGARLGRGGGFYDELIRAIRRDAPAGRMPPVIAYCYPQQVVPAAGAEDGIVGAFVATAASQLEAPTPFELPVASHDEPVTHVVLPQGVVRCSRS